MPSLPNLFVSLFAIFLCVGCGSGQLPTAPVSGKVTFDGKPVTSGTVTFAPLNQDGTTREGKPAIGTIDKTGYFVLTTYEENDGAIIGKHRVTYSPPEGGGSEEESVKEGEGGEEAASPVVGQEPRFEFELEVAEISREVEVKDQENSFSILLSRIRGEENEED